MYFIEGVSTDPRFNLAFEETVFNAARDGESYFLLWQNDRAVIVGRNQNTVEEINRDFVREHDIRVVRRISGGGAVYHDLGNINYTFISDKKPEEFDFRFFTRPIIRALEKFSVKAEFNGRNDLSISGRKFSGSAQHIAGNRVLHHGTLLYDSDLDKMNMVLNVKEDKIRSKGIQSVRSRVTNISEHMQTKLPVPEFKELLKKFIFEQDDIREIQLSELQLQNIEKLRELKYDTWEWNYGRSPAYNLLKERRFASGILSVYLMIDAGIIREIRLYGDFFGRGDIGFLEKRLIGRKNEMDSIAQALETIDVGRYISGLTGEDLARLIAF